MQKIDDTLRLLSRKTGEKDLQEHGAAHVIKARVFERGDHPCKFRFACGVVCALKHEISLARKRKICEKKV